MRFAKKKKGQKAGIATSAAGVIVLLLLVAAAAVLIIRDGGVEIAEFMSISRWTGAYTEVDLVITNPDVQEGSPLLVEYSVFNHGRERSVCGFIELWADTSLQDSRYFCISNTNNYGRDATRLDENISITGLKEGKHQLILKYALASESYVDVDDEYLKNYRDCPDNDTFIIDTGYVYKVKYYQPDVNNAFRMFLPYMPCEIKNAMPGVREEFEYDGSLVDYALSINPDFEYETMTKTFFMASQGTFDKADLADEQAEEIKGLEFQLEQLQNELDTNNELSSAEKAELRQQIEELEDLLAQEKDEEPGFEFKPVYIVLGIAGLLGMGMVIIGVFLIFVKK